MKEIYVLIGGKAGFGIDTSGLIIARLLNQMGYRLYVYRDYPSLIRGGHTFCIVRAAEMAVSAHQNKADFLLALNQDTFNFHKEKLKETGSVIFDTDSVKAEGLPPGQQAIGIPITKIIKEENAAEIMRNTCIIGAFCKAAGIPWDIAEKVLRSNIPREIELNLKIALKGYEALNIVSQIEKLNQEPLPLITGNEAISLGLIKGGLRSYVAYPMTPTSSILHFMAQVADDFGLKVLHPESEISVILMALGFAYMGQKAAVATSGGGFCLMAEGLSFAGMAELPIVIVLGQRTGPSTGLPTYTGQSELFFALNAGQGEFCKFLVAPADAEEAYLWSAISLNLSWKYQIPALILTDKTLSEGTYNFNPDLCESVKEENPLLWDGKEPYQRYWISDTGVSQLAFPPAKAMIKVNSYEHDDFGITTEDPAVIQKMQEKRLRKEQYLSAELNKYETVKVYGDKNSATAIICWGSNRGVCAEAGERSGLRVVQPVVLWPFPKEKLENALSGVNKIICIENNATGQLANLMNCFGIKVSQKILKYDGRPFFLEELEAEIRRQIK